MLRQIGFGFFLLVAMRRVILAIFVLTAMSSTMVIRTLDTHDIDRAVIFIFPGILVLIL
jgi:hypothetical protein